jgi:hypothetical protein
MTGVLGATLGLPAVAPSPFGNASYHINNDLVISAEPITRSNPHNVMHFPSIFNPAFAKALDAAVTPPNF